MLVPCARRARDVRAWRERGVSVTCCAQSWELGGLWLRDDARTHGRAHGTRAQAPPPAGGPEACGEHDDEEDDTDEDDDHDEVSYYA